MFADKNIKDNNTDKKNSFYEVVSQLVTFIDDMDKKKEAQEQEISDKHIVN